MENEFPPNSHAKKEARPARPSETTSDRKEVARVATGKVIRRKRPLHKRFLDAFRPEDNKGFIEYVLLDMLVPGIKDTIADAGIASIENALGSGGHSRSRGRSRGGGGSGGYTSYNRMSSSRGSGRRDDDRRPAKRESRGPSDHQELVFETRVEANEVLDQMFEMVSKYEVVTMRDLLSLAGEPHSFTDEDWGWLDLRGSSVHRVNGGYLLDLPRPEPLD